MKVLVVNCGSSSLKYQIIDMKDESVLVKGNVEKIGEAGSFLKYQPTVGEKVVFEKEIKDHTIAMKMVVDVLLDEKIGVLKDINEISAIGHRIVHGGEKFTKSVLVDENVIDGLRQCVDIAPLHTPAHLMGIEACINVMPNIPMVTVFDTAFHQTMPKKSYMYGLPYEFYDKYKVRKYGFHGTSHNYVYNRAAEILGKDPNNMKAITCHLGNGASICAIHNGKSINTSMGFTPLEGLVMGTRCGNIDPAAVTYIMERENMSPKQTNEFLNKKCGMIALSKVSNDFRDIEEAANNGDENCKLALDIFAQRVRQYIGSYATDMNGVDVVIFTAGIGEMSPETRSMIIDGLSFMGIEIDQEKNNVRGKETNISKDGSKVITLVVPTNEELMIARETASILK